MFSSISPNYEQNLKDELFGCFKYIGIPFDTLERMPVRDRKYYIMRHNKLTEEENAKNKHTNTIGGDMINAFTDMDMKIGQRS